MWENIKKMVMCLCTGQFRRIWNEVHVRLYRWAWEARWTWILPRRRAGRPPAGGVFTLETRHPVAIESPDHLAPKGTAVNNSTNKKFVLLMDQVLRDEFPGVTPRTMDLGCSGGQVVIDFLKLAWGAVGLEGSDFSLRRRRGNWAAHAGRHLFTCDITKPCQLRLDEAPVRFHLVTAWEVLEHIREEDLPQVFENIVRHLEPGGRFIASTTETTDIHEGMELHQTRWNNARWRTWVEATCPELEWADPGLRAYQYVRCNFLHPSFLLYRRRTSVGSAPCAG